MLHHRILASVPRQLQNLRVECHNRTNAAIHLRPLLQLTMDTTNRELTYSKVNLPAKKLHNNNVVDIPYNIQIYLLTDI
jgi:hypothetical protein